MTPEEAAARTAVPINQVPSLFMLDAATYTYGGELGFNGVDFYLAGRCGPLGDVHPDVATAALVFFNGTLVRTAWEASASVMTRSRAAEEFIGCGHRWADENLAGTCDTARLAELAGKAAAGADPAGAPLFAAWRSQPEPAGLSSAALALHRVNLLRELRGALHGAAVLASGLRPVEALMIRTPIMAAIFGWHEVVVETEALQERWDAAEAATNVAMAEAFTHLDLAERVELDELLQDAYTATKAR